MGKNGQRNVLITGGTGFVCMNIAETLLDHGFGVVAFARHPLQEQAMQEFSAKKGSFHYCLGDVLNPESLASVISQYNITDVIHGAAITPSREAEMKSPKQIIEINVLGLMNTLDAAREAHLGRFIYLGSISGYGQTCFNSELLVEGESLGDPHSLYEISKFTGERIVQRYRDLFQMDAAVARVGDVFGPWERDTGVRSYMSFPYQLVSAARNGRKVILPKPNCIDWVYGKDIAVSVYELLCTEKLQHDIYPLCSGYIWPLTDWCKLLESRFSGFNWKMAQAGDEPTIHVNQTEDNAPMQIDRLFAETGYKPIYDMVHAFKDYMDWIETHPGYVE